MLQGVIFDMDGTLIDSEHIWVSLNRQLIESFGKTYDPAWHQLVRGTGAENVMRSMKDYFDLPIAFEELLQRKREALQQVLHQQLPTKKAGADLFMQSLKQANVPFALGTSADRPFAMRVLTGHGWLDDFTAIVTVEDVDHHKPAPDTFLEAARRMQCDPARCVVFEDAPAGVAAARAAGMRVVGVRDAQQPDLLSHVDRLIDDFNQLTPNDLRRLFD